MDCLFSPLFFSKLLILVKCLALFNEHPWNMENPTEVFIIMHI